jgi:ferredoxin
MAKPFFIDDEECISCGSCAEICPECFSFKDEMSPAGVISFDCEIDLIEEAMENCPTQCIHWEDDEELED